MCCRPASTPTPGNRTDGQGTGTGCACRRSPKHCLICGRKCWKKTRFDRSAPAKGSTHPGTRSATPSSASPRTVHATSGSASGWHCIGQAPRPSNSTRGSISGNSGRSRARRNTRATASLPPNGQASRSTRQRLSHWGHCFTLPAERDGPDRCLMPRHCLARWRCPQPQRPSWQGCGQRHPILI